MGRAQKRLEAKYFYHREGSRLFDRICELEEYYPTRTETRILRDNAHGLSEILSASSALVELDALPEIATYVPLDISGEYLNAAAKRIAADYPRYRGAPGGGGLHPADDAAARHSDSNASPWRARALTSRRARRSTPRTRTSSLWTASERSRAMSAGRRTRLGRRCLALQRARSYARLSRATSEI